MNPAAGACQPSVVPTRHVSNPSTAKSNGERTFVNPRSVFAASGPTSRNGEQDGASSTALVTVTSGGNCSRIWSVT